MPLSAPSLTPNSAPTPTPTHLLQLSPNVLPQPDSVVEGGGGEVHWQGHHTGLIVCLSGRLFDILKHTEVVQMLSKD